MPTTWSPWTTTTRKRANARVVAVADLARRVDDEAAPVSIVAECVPDDLHELVTEQGG